MLTANAIQDTSDQKGKTENQPNSNLVFKFICHDINTHLVSSVCLFKKEREDVPVEMNAAEPGFQHYEQLRYNNMWFKVGDCVYIKSHGLSKPRVARWVKIYFSL